MPSWSGIPPSPTSRPSFPSTPGAYRSPTDAGGPWNENHLRSHLHVFPEGQLLAEKDGKILGVASSLIVSLGRNPLRKHTYDGITDDGYFYNHDPQGDTLYGADV